MKGTDAPESARPPNPSPQGSRLAGKESRRAATLLFTALHLLGTYGVAGGAWLEGVV